MKLTVERRKGEKKMENNTNHGLPLQAFAEIPEAKPDAKKITALVKKGSVVTGYQLCDGRILKKEQAVALARQGEIAGAGIATNKGTEYLKSLPDAEEGNNFSHLPSIPEQDAFNE